MFDLPDEHFVCEAYLRVLGRAPDPQGFLSYVAALRRRLSRPGLIRDLQRSPEWQGQLHRPEAVGLHCAPDLWPLPWRRFQGLPFTRSRRDLLQIEGELFAHASCWLCWDASPRRPSCRAGIRRPMTRPRGHNGWSDWSVKRGFAPYAGGDASASASRGLAAGEHRPRCSRAQPGHTRRQQKHQVVPFSPSRPAATCRSCVC